MDIIIQLFKISFGLGLFAVGLVCSISIIKVLIEVGATFMVSILEIVARTLEGRW